MLRSSNPVSFYANGIGDAFLNLPALRALAHCLNGRMMLVTQTDTLPLGLAELDVRRVVELEMSWDNGSRAFDVRMALDAIGECDLFLSLVPWESQALRDLLAGLAPRASVGFFPSFDISLPLDYNKHSVDLAFDVPRILDPSLLVEDFAWPPRFDDAGWRRASQVRRTLPEWARILAVHNETLREKTWPTDWLVVVLDRFLECHPDYWVVVVGTKPEAVDVGRHGNRVLPFYELDRITALSHVAQSDAFLGVDSCMLHVADLFRVAGVGLFGCTNPVEFGFRFGPHRHVIGAGKMNDIKSDAVLLALQELVASQD